MLTITELSHAFGKRVLFDNASAFISDGWKVGLIGRNGTGKSTLLKLIQEETGKPNSPFALKRGARMGFVAQEIPANDTPLLDLVLSIDSERHNLLEEAETATDPDRIGEIHDRLLDIDAYSAPARASEILHGLGFKQEDLERASREFSGGWRMRGALAGVLVSQPDLLILDEPTNYLDLEGAAWLEEYIVKYPHTVLMVSHDREMLNRSVTHILALDSKQLDIYNGGYDTYLRRRAEKTAHLAGQKAKQDAQREHLQSFVDRFRAKATKARQAQARIKMLEKMQEIEVPIQDRTAPFHFYEAPEISSPLVQLEGADLGYEHGHPVLRNVDFRLDNDDRIVIIGPNGQGKTTLVKSIGGKLHLLNGERRSSHKIQIGYFSQDSLDELTSGSSVLEHIKWLEHDAGESKLRSIAAQFGFGEEKVNTMVEKLSGGEKVRLLMGITAYKRPNILILDEPTSHLDIDSREALIHALNDFKGAVLLITHDVYLAEATADSLWLVNDGHASLYDGDLSDYRKMVLNSDRPDASANKPKAPKTKSEKPKYKASNNQIQTAKRKVAKLEKEIEDLRNKLSDVAKKLESQEVISQVYDKMQELSEIQEKHQQKLNTKEEEWLLASEELDAL